jgi:hypothetical protein
MFDIGVLATGAEFAIIALLAAGTATATIGAIQQGKAAEAQSKSEQDILNFNAAQKVKEAEEHRTAAQEQAAKFAKQGRRLRGTQRVAIARGGVLAVGTPALLLEETAQELEADRLAILEQGFLRGEFAESEAFGARFAGVSARARGRNIKRGSRLAAGGTLLTGLGSVGLARQQLKTET